MEGSGKKDAFTPTEVDTLMAELPDNLLGNSIRVLLISGLRVQELLALTPGDIAEDGSHINVDKAIKMVDGIPTLGVPKARRAAESYRFPWTIGAMCESFGNKAARPSSGPPIGRICCTTPNIFARSTTRLSAKFPECGA